MDGVTLADLKARRAALDEEIREVENRERNAWNTALGACENALGAWLNEHDIEWMPATRKNETTWDVGHGALHVTFGAAEENYSRSLRLLSGKTLSAEWSEEPDPARFLAIVAALLGKAAP
jgi:hypothetical protein